MANLGEFKDIIYSGNVLDIRILMKNSMRFDPSFELFNAIENFASTIPGLNDKLYDDHDGEVFNTDESSWDDDYMDYQMVRVIDNFSHERLDHLKDIVRKLRPVTKAPPQKAPQTSKSKQPNYQRQKKEDQANGSFVRAAPAALFGGLLAGGVAAIAGASGGAVAAIAGAGAVAAAAITLLATKEER